MMLVWRIREAIKPPIFHWSLTAFQRNQRDSLYRWLDFGWGNVGWSADPGYLRAVTEYARRTEGPILECGSGLTSLLLGIVAPGRTISLEHTPKWKTIVEASAAKYSISVDIRSTELVSYGDFEWYDIPDDLKEMRFGLVICDGPPSETRGGRFGLMPAARSFLNHECVILMDDAEREDERRIIQQWKSDFDLESEVREDGKQEHAILRFRNPAAFST